MYIFLLSTISYFSVFFSLFFFVCLFFPGTCVTLIFPWDPPYNYAFLKVNILCSTMNLHDQYNKDQYDHWYEITNAHLVSLINIYRLKFCHILKTWPCYTPFKLDMDDVMIDLGNSS